MDAIRSEVRCEELRLTNLFGSTGVSRTPFDSWGSMGAVEPFEKVTEGDPGPGLEVGLAFWEVDTLDSRFNHALPDDTEPTRSSPLPS